MTIMALHSARLLSGAALLAALPVYADDIPANGMTATANINLVSQYRFRGIDQTWGKPAVQGGVDLTLPQGFYAGVWASNISGNSYPGGSVEVDYYGGYNLKLSEDWSATVGGYGYWYPGANVNRGACPSAAYAMPCSQPSQRFNTFELNAGVTWKWISYKLSVSATDYFGANTATGYSRGTRGSLYHDLTATVPFADGWSMVAHIGRTDVRAQYGAVNPDYTDYRLALVKTFPGGWNASAAVIGASNNAFFRPPTGGLSAGNGDTRVMNKTMLVLQAGRTF